MNDEATITLVAGQYEALDGVHCGVSKFGQVTVAGDTTMLEDGQSHVFARPYRCLEAPMVHLRLPTDDSSSTYSTGVKSKPGVDNRLYPA